MYYTIGTQYRNRIGVDCEVEEDSENLKDNQQLYKSHKKKIVLIFRAALLPLQLGAFGGSTVALTTRPLGNDVKRIHQTTGEAGAD
jgi:hypothetical protein